MSENIPRPIPRVYRGDPVEAKWANNIKAHIEAIVGISDDVENYYQELNKKIENLDIPEIDYNKIDQNVQTYVQEMQAAMDRLDSELKEARAALEKADESLSRDLIEANKTVEGFNKQLTDENSQLNKKITNAQSRLDELSQKLSAQDQKIASSSQKALEAHNLAVQTKENVVVGTKNEYAKNRSHTSAPHSLGWSETPPSRGEGEVLWVRTTITYGDGRTVLTPATPLTGDKGADGDDGTDGAPGPKGKDGIDGAPGPQGPKGKDGTDGKPGPPGADGAPGPKGKDGIDGKPGEDGVSVTAIEPFYRWSKTQPARPSGVRNPSGWYLTEPAYVEDSTLWRTDRVSYSNGTATWTLVTKATALEAAKAEVERASGRLRTEIRQSANSKNSIIRSNRSPHQNGSVDGDLWWQVDGNGNVIGQWVWAASKWEAALVESKAIASLDVNKLTASSAKMQEAVVDRIWADGISAKSIATSNLAITGENLVPGYTEAVEAGNPIYHNFDEGPEGSFGWTGYRTAAIYPAIPLEAGQEYLFEVEAKSEIAGAVFYIRVDKGDIKGLSSYGSFPGHRGVYPLLNISTTTEWKKFSNTWSPRESGIACLRVWLNHPNSVDQSGGQWLRNLTVRKRNSGELLVDGSIQAHHVASDSITTRHLTIAPGNMVADPNFLRPDDWSTNGGTVRFESDTVVVPGNPGSDTSISLGGSLIDVLPGTSYRVGVETHTNHTGVHGKKVWVGVSWFDDTRKYISRDGDYGNEGQQTNDGWKPFTRIVTAPDNARYAEYRIWSERRTSSAIVKFRNPSMVSAADASLIVDGSINARHAAFELADITGTLNANRVRGGSLDFENIEVKNFRGDNIEGGKIKADLIQANTFTHLGTSILGNVPGTTIPQWIELVGPYDDDTAPSPFSGRYIEGTENVVPEFIPVTIRQNTKYRAQVWVPEDQGTFKWLALNFINLTPGAKDEFVWCRINTVYEPDRVVNGWRQMYATFEFPKHWETAALYNLFESTGKEMIISGLEVTEDYAQKKDLFDAHQEQLKSLDENQTNLGRDIDDLSSMIQRHSDTLDMHKDLLENQGISGVGYIAPNTILYAHKETLKIFRRGGTQNKPFVYHTMRDTIIDVYWIYKDYKDKEIKAARMLMKYEEILECEWGMFFWRIHPGKIQKVQKRYTANVTGSLYASTTHASRTPVPGLIHNFPENTKHTAVFRLEGGVRLLKANRGSFYRLGIYATKKNGDIETLAERTWDDLGPLTPLGDGTRTLTISADVGDGRILDTTYKSIHLGMSTSNKNFNARLMDKDKNRTYLYISAEHALR